MNKRAIRNNTNPFPHEIPLKYAPYPPTSSTFNHKSVCINRRRERGYSLTSRTPKMAKIAITILIFRCIQLLCALLALIGFSIYKGVNHPASNRWPVILLICPLLSPLPLQSHLLTSPRQTDLSTILCIAASIYHIKFIFINKQHLETHNKRWYILQILQDLGLLLLLVGTICAWAVVPYESPNRYHDFIEYWNGVNVYAVEIVLSFGLMFAAIFYALSTIMVGIEMHRRRRNGGRKEQTEGSGFNAGAGAGGVV